MAITDHHQDFSFPTINTNSKQQQQLPLAQFLWPNHHRHQEETKGYHNYCTEEEDDDERISHSRQKCIWRKSYSNLGETFKMEKIHDMSDDDDSAATADEKMDGLWEDFNNAEITVSSNQSKSKSSSSSSSPSSPSPVTGNDNEVSEFTGDLGMNSSSEKTLMARNNKKLVVFRVFKVLTKIFSMQRKTRMFNKSGS